MRADLEQKIRLLPKNPGVYVMLDADGTIIYVGKAKNLKNRVTQYFYDNVKTEKVSAMTANIADFYYIITNSEADALKNATPASPATALASRVLPVPGAP